MRSFATVRNTSERLCKPLCLEDYVPQPHADVSPPRWHMALTTWFFEELVLKAIGPGYQALHPYTHGLTGRVWQWTSSSYAAYPGFRARQGPRGEYNGKFMVNQQVLLGGGVASAEGHLRDMYRNFRHANKRWQFTGSRSAEDA